MATDPSKIPKSEARRIYLNQRTTLETRYKDNPKALRIALDKYEKAPLITKLRERAGMPTPAVVTTRKQELKGSARYQPNVDKDRARRAQAAEIARQRIQSKKLENKDSIIPESLRDVGAGALGGMNDAFFGIPARGAAALVGVDNDVMQEFADQQGRRAPVTNFLSTLAGSLASGSGLLRGGQAVTSALVKSAVPAIAKTGRAAQAAGRAATITKGQTGKNVLRLAAGGAAAGGATEAIKERDVATGAATGAAGAVALGAGFKAASWLGGKAGEALRLSGADAIFRRYTDTTREELQRRLDTFRAEGRAEPTLFELLDLKDRKSLQGIFGRLDSRQAERGAELARSRVESIPGEIAQVVRNETRGQRKANIETLASAQRTSRVADDADPAPDLTTAEARLAVGAADNPTRLAQIRQQEARNIMAPFDNQRAVDDINDLIPTEMRAGNNPGEVVEAITDPEIASVIRSAAGLARIRPEGEGITVREVTGMITKLKEGLGKADPIQAGNIQRAVDHLEGVLDENIPNIGVALNRMNERWAARSRQLEGMQETRPQADINPNSFRAQQKSQNVFETPEGAAGRQSAQRNELIDDLGAANSPALGTVRELAESPTKARQVAQNLGVPATRNITEAARTQSESVRRLATAIRDPNFDATDIEAGDLALLAAALNPASMAYTKANAIARMYQRFAKSIPEARSRTIVDMLFSRDPAMTQRAINALRSEGERGANALSDILKIVGGPQALGNLAEPVPGTPPEADTATEAPVEAETDDVDYSTMSDEELLAAIEAEGAQEETDYAEMSDEELLAAIEAEKAQGPYGRRVIEDLFPDAQITDDMRDPNSDLGRKNPGSYHVATDGAVDLRPIPGMTFNEFVETLKAEGYDVVEAIDETKKKNRARHATGPHWHVVIG